ncbi:hypothetical protein Nepgr_000749 [Nepenthes gracilis]|uniref:Pentatricopeptide repeat-containing protein n=1 Tax=Nepenthes gracilis TaxID=150966 RepID=A0AAD3RX32_NEPGR|nr:hypothetical protein Nepgr_000749 [Nepenthes gracilis]
MSRTSCKHEILSVLNACKQLREFKQLHAHIITQPNLSPHEISFLVSKLASRCAVSPHGSFAYAKTVFGHLQKPPVSLWNSLIRGLFLINKPLEALVLYRSLILSELKPNNFTYPFLIKACTGLTAPQYGILIHAHVVRRGLELDPHIQSSLIRFYTNGSDLGSARQVFEMCCDDDVVSWNSMIDGCVKCGDVVLARLIFDKMIGRDVISWNSMIHGYGVMGKVEEARKLFDEMPQRNVITYNSMLGAFAKCGKVDDAVSVFRKMPYRDIVSWNAMLACYGQCGRPSEALTLFREMLDAHVKPTKQTFASMLSACARLGALDQGRAVHEFMNRHEIEVNYILKTALVDMYARSGSISDAAEVFYSIDAKDILAWNTIISGMAIHGRGEEALQTFEDMQGEGVEPNDMTFVALLSACSHAGMVEEGQRLLDCMGKNYGMDPKIEHYGCITDLLARSGHMEKAVEFVVSMPMEPNSIIWGALFGGCRIHATSEVGEMVGRCLIGLEPYHSGRYVLLSNIYSAAKRWDNASQVRNLMKARRVVKMPGVSIVQSKAPVGGRLLLTPLSQALLTPSSVR